MTTVQGYYDGSHYVTLEKVDVKPNQKVRITILDDFINLEDRKKKTEALFGCLHEYADPVLREKEGDAWGMAVEEQYGLR